MKTEKAIKRQIWGLGKFLMLVSEYRENNGYYAMAD